MAKTMPSSVVLWMLVGAFTILAAVQTYREMKETSATYIKVAGKKSK